MPHVIPTRSDVPSLLGMAAFFLAFGLFGMLMPDTLRAVMDNLAKLRKEGSWHPYKMPRPVLRIAVGTTGVLGSALFVYIAYVALSR